MSELEELQADNERLKKELSELQTEHILVVKTIVRVLNSIGLWPIAKGDNITAKALKAVKGVIGESVYNPKGLEKRFAFIDDIYPLAEKYKDIQI